MSTIEAQRRGVPLRIESLRKELGSNDDDLVEAAMREISSRSERGGESVEWLTAAIAALRRELHYRNGPTSLVDGLQKTLSAVSVRVVRDFPKRFDDIIAKSSFPSLWK